MARKKVALMTGLFSALGLAAYLGHKKQVAQQDREQAILAEVRNFFAPMGNIAVVYANPNQEADAAMTGGVVFDDGVMFEYQYDRGHIDYREGQKVEESHD